MEKLSECLIRAIEYLNRRNDQEYLEDDDLKIIEEVSHILTTEASAHEKQELIKVSKNLGYETWAKNMGIEED